MTHVHDRHGRAGVTVPTVLVAAVLMLAGSALADELAYAPAPPDNPLKGFVPYANDVRTFPHSMEWFYLAVGDVMLGPDTFDWSELEQRLDAIAERGHQAIFRFYLDYPSRPSGVPEYLREAGLEIRTWENPNADGRTSLTPDYEDPRLREAMRNFIAAFGERYDGDVRIGYITAGLLGSWGEWHEYPRMDWFASRQVQREVLDAYEAAFEQTPILLRYPAGEDDPHYAETGSRPFGYHDDSFCWSTRDTGPEWHFMAIMRRADALDNWRSHPVGGEVRPEIWYTLWDEPTGAPEGQEYEPTVDDTHATWLLFHGVFDDPPEGEARERALAGARQLGYELQVTHARLRPDQVTLKVTNHGVAPFYHDWPVELAAFPKGAEADEPAAVWQPDWRLGEVQPGEEETVWNHAIDLPAGAYHLLLRVPNPLEQGEPVRFANEAQDSVRNGWLTLGSVQVD